MPKFVIEREIPGAGQLSQQELHAISQKSCSVLQEMGPRIQWQESFVTGDKIYCVYIAPDEATVREHAEGRISGQCGQPRHQRDRSDHRRLSQPAGCSRARPIAWMRARRRASS